MDEVENPRAPTGETVSPPPEIASGNDTQNSGKINGYPNLRPIPKGVSLNPGGRKAIPVKVRRAARAFTVEAIGLLMSMGRDEKTPADTRRRCLNDVLDRAWGKVPASVEQRVVGRPDAPLGPLVNINMPGSGDLSRLSPEQAYAFIVGNPTAAPEQISQAERVIQDAAATSRAKVLPAPEVPSSVVGLGKGDGVEGESP